MRVALVNQFYPPGRAPTGKLLHDLAVALCERGHDVTVITSLGIYGGGEESIQETDGMTVCRLGRGGLHRTGFVQKLFDYLAFFPRAYGALSRLEPAPDVVVSMTTPPFCGLIAARLKRKRGIPFVLWCMDLYPEALAAAGVLKENGLLYKLLSRLTRGERTCAERIITLGPDMTDRIHSVLPGARVEEIPVWSSLCPSPAAEASAQKLRRTRGWADDETILLYSGNIGRAHRVEEFVALAERLRESSHTFRLVICGEGSRKREWRHKGSGLFEWIHPVGEESLTAHLLAADIHLISQRSEWTGIVVPSKYQAACALGRPVLFAGPVESTVAQWIQASGTGWILPPGDAEAMDHIVQALLQPREISQNRFEADCLLSRLAEQVEQAGRHGGL
jgi:colanic acid biosynthesis glycosyl transferase WcaI